MTGFVKRVEPVVADHGEGALLYDADGTEYIDCFAGISVTNAGHGNRKIIEAAKAQADKLVHACTYVYHVEAAADLAELLAQITPGRPQEDLLRQLRRRGHRGRHAPGQALLGQARVRGPRVELPRPHLRHAQHHRQLGPQEGRRPVHGRRGLRPDPVLLPLPAQPRGRELRHGLRPARGRDGSPQPQRRRVRLHRRARHGRGRHHRPAGRLLQGRQGVDGRRGRALHLRRGAVGLRPHRQDVRHRALRRGARTSSARPRASPTAGRWAPSRPRRRSPTPSRWATTSAPSAATR